jgi:shikimate kinase
MTRVLVTGMSGAGKTTLLAGLRARGYLTVETDVDGWTLPDGTWDEPRMRDLLAAHREIIVSGTVENQADFYAWFDHIVLLSAPLAALLERVTTRTNNPYGQSRAQQAEIAGYVDTIEPLLRRGATLELDGRDDRSALVDAVEALL